MLLLSVVMVVMCIDFFVFLSFTSKLQFALLSSISLLSLLNHSKKGTSVGSEESTLAHLNFLKPTLFKPNQRGFASVITLRQLIS